MCANIVEKARVTGSGKAGHGWMRLDEAVVSYDHPFHARVDHAVNIDFVNDGGGMESRVAVELTLESARELAHWSILVNAVAPGLIDTDMAAAVPADAREALLAQVPLKRIGTVQDVAEVIAFLAGDGAAYITGQVVHVNGGLYM